jgi:hypothetical protein
MEPQRAPAPPVNPTEKVVELRNVREISRAAQYTEEELKTHLQLGTADTEGKTLLINGLAEVVKNIGLGQTNHEIAASIDALLTTVSQLDQSAADLIAGAEAHVAELATQLEQRQSAGDTPTTTTLADIDAELKRRMDIRGTVAGPQVEYEDELAEMNSRFDVLGERLKNGDTSVATKTERRELEGKIDALEATVGTIIKKMADFDYKVQLLVAYKSAIQLLDQGLPPGIIGEKLFDFSKK